MRIIQTVTRLLACCLCVTCASTAQAFFTMTEATAQSCAGFDSMSDGAVGVAAASSQAQSSGMCQDGRISAATSSASADIASATISVAGDGSGDQDINGAFGQASFSERLTIENVPAGIDDIDLAIEISFLGTPPAAAFYNSASFTGTVNAQVVPGDVRLEGCSGDLCIVPLPVRDETLQQTITLSRNGLGEFGFIDVFLDARFSIASASSSIQGSVSVGVVGVPEATIVSESGVFATSMSDSDADGIPDASDNCTLIENGDQRDSDADGFGNICDADLNNDCIVNAVDLGVMRSVFFTADADADFNGDGTVNTTDLGIMRLQFFGAPGPSGLPNACDP